MLIKRQSSECLSVVAFLLISTLFCGMLSSVSADKSDMVYQGTDPCDYIENLSFDSTSANASVSWQTELGPRLPGSNASANLRLSIIENLTDFSFTESSHQRENFTLTNLVGTYSPANSTGQNVVLVAHYDSRFMADRDDNESMIYLPIDGANDGASGVAVLIEMGKIIPSMELNHDVTLFFTDAEDQGTPSYPKTWSYGADAWVENLTEDYRDNISAYIVVDMIGDAFLDFTKVSYTSNDLWDTVTPITAALGMMENQVDCYGNLGQPIYDSSKTRSVIDDHIAAHQAGIPAINFIDLNYGENASFFGGYWHTHDDTADKVSAESLGLIGNILELGLVSSAWTLTEEPSENNANDNEANSNGGGNSQAKVDNTVEKSKFVGYVAIGIVSLVLITILIVDIRNAKQ